MSNSRWLIGGLAAMALATAAPAAAPPALSLEAISAPAEFVSGGGLLIAIHGGEAPVTVTVNGAPYGGVWRRAATPGRPAEIGALVEGLRLGANTIVARQGKASATLKVLNHPITGPILSGPHIKPFVCMTQDFHLPNGTTLGKPLDEDCSAPTRVQYLYKPKGQTQLKYLANPDRTPADADTATTLDKVTVPFVVRVETGTINRGVYQYAVLHNPQTDGALSPTNPPKGWARRLLAVHGTGCPRGWYIQGAAMGVSPIDQARLAQGLAIFTNTLNHPTNSCNMVLAGETTLMVRQHVIEALGRPLYTLSMGSSGGAYTSLQIADEFPGLIDGVLSAATFSDALVIAMQGSDGHLINRYFREIAGKDFTPIQQQAVGGYGVPIGLQANGNQAGRTDPVPDRKDQEGYASAVWNPAVPAALRYDPKTSPRGVRPTVFDWAVNVYGRDPKTGFARRTFDNVGVQYGLKALNDGVISKAQFIDLNARVGGLDNDANYIPARSVGDPIGIANAYKAGLMLSGGRGLSQIPVLDYSGIYSDLRATGDYHMKHHHFTVRERIRRWNGDADNMVMWSDGGAATGGAGRGGAAPDAEPAGGNTAAEAFLAIDKWLVAVKSDARPGTGREKAIRNRPASVTDGCFTAGQQRRFIAEKQDAYADSQCNRLYPVHSFPRGVAGAPLSADILKCALKPLDAKDYKVAFTREERAKLKAAFPSGVCDWTKLGQGQARSVPWSRW